MADGNDDGRIDTTRAPVRAGATLRIPDLKVAEASRTPSWVYDLDSARIVWANGAALDVWRAASLTELKARDLGRGMSDSARERLAGFRREFDRGAVFDEFWTIHPKGKPRNLMCRFRGIALPDGRMGMYCEAEELARASEELTRTANALLFTSALVTVYDRAGVCVYMNPAARRVFAANLDRLDQRIVPDDLVEALLEFDPDDSQGRFTTAVDTVQGRRIHELDVVIAGDATAEERQLTITAIDVTDREMDRERMRFLARHDPMTGLINRNAATGLIEDMIALDTEGELRIRACFLDLDRFKLVNDTMGHKAGDFVLVEVARRLRARVADRCQVARLGGDEFLIFCCTEMEDAAFDAMMEEVRVDLARPYRIMEHRFELTASIGVGLYPEHGASFDELLNAADLALYDAKEGGGDRMRVYDGTVHKAQDGLLQMETDLRDALREDALSMWFQPRISADGASIAGVEALVRWIREDGAVPPDQFIPVAERSGMIHDLGCRVLKDAAAHQKRLKEAGHGIAMSVNVSGKQFGDPALLACLEEIAADPEIDPARFELEITETIFVSESARLDRVLRRIGELGFPLAIDDFGTAYSNMAALRRYPIDCIKIDRSLVAADGFEHLTLGVITMARALGVKVVAEGVEGEAQARWLAENGCDEFQGHYFREAMPFDALIAVLEAAR